MEGLNLYVMKNIKFKYRRKDLFIYLITEKQKVKSWNETICLKAIFTIYLSL